MSVYDEYPQFDGLSSSVMSRLIIEARFNDEGHAIAERMIEKYKSTEAYRSNPEYARGMTDAWKAIHAEMRAQSAKVAAMINQYK